MDLKGKKNIPSRLSCPHDNIFVYITLKRISCREDTATGQKHPTLSPSASSMNKNYPASKCPLAQR
jgi:hypothetical protein